MITAERKPLSEIKEMIAPYKKVLVVGCGTCVAECASGGEKETGLLASALRMDAKASGKDIRNRPQLEKAIDALGTGVDTE